MEALTDRSRRPFRLANQLPLLAIDQLHANAGELLMIHGPSGSGKTTLLSLMAGVLTPQQGQVKVSGIAINNLSAAARDRFRGQHIGVVFQQFNLLPYLSVLQNVMLPAELFDQRAQRVLSGCTTLEEGAQRVLSELDLQAALWHQLAHTLSVGQQPACGGDAMVWPRAACSLGLTGAGGFLGDWHGPILGGYGRSVLG